MDEEGSGSGVDREAGGGDIGVRLAVLGPRCGENRENAGRRQPVGEAFRWSSKWTCLHGSGIRPFPEMLETELCDPASLVLPLQHPGISGLFLKLFEAILHVGETLRVDRVGGKVD